MDGAVLTARIIRELDAAGAQQESWETGLRSIAGLVGAKSGFLRVVGAQANQVEMSVSSGYDESFVRLYREHFVHLDPYRRHFRTAPPGSLLVTDRLVDRRRHQQTEYFNAYERPQDLYHAAGGTVSKTAFGTIELGFQRGRRAGAFGVQQLNRLQSLFPHVQRAVLAYGLGTTFAATEEMFASALERLMCGLVLIDQGHRCRFANERARCLALSRGIKLGYAGVQLSSPEDTLALNRLIAEALAGRKGSTVSLQGASDIEWTAVPLNRATQGAGLTIGIALYMKERSSSPADVAALAAAFGLSTAEARVVKGITAGMSLQDIAAQSRVSIHTVRSQLARCFAKTQTHKQIELASLAAGMRTAPDRRKAW